MGPCRHVGALAAEVGPEPAGAGSAGARRQHGDGRVVRVQDPAAEDAPGERVHQGTHRRGRPPDPAGERRALQLDAVAGVDRALPVERRVVGVLRRQRARERARRRAAAADGQARRRRPGDPLAAPARPAGADAADHAEPARRVVEDLGHVLAGAPQRAAAGGARADVRAAPHRLARQVVRHGAARGLAALPAPLIALRVITTGRRWGGRVRFEVLQREFELVGLGRDALGGAAELHPPRPGELDAQPPDELALPGDPGALGEHDRARRRRVVGQGCGVGVHGRTVARGAAASRRMTPARAWWTTPPSPAARSARGHPPVDPFREHRELRWRGRHHPVLGLRPNELPAFQPLGVEHEALGVPPQHLHEAAAAAAEDEQVAAERVRPGDGPHLPCQPVEAAPRVGRPRREPDAGAGRERDHGKADAAPGPQHWSGCYATFRAC